MATSYNRTGLSLGAKLLIALLLILAGAAAATWALARNQQAARFLGVTPPPAKVVAAPQALIRPPTATQQQEATAEAERRIVELEARLARVETTAQKVEGSAGRADALLVAFAARRAVERGVALGYLEPLLVDRFGAQHPGAVSTIVTSSRTPVRLAELINEYEALGPSLRSSAPSESMWAGVKRELASLVEIRHSSRPSQKPDARYDRARARLAAGEVDAALAETMRMPGAPRAGAWIQKARHYVAARRALDEIESSALLGSGRAG
jgi:hypothetical protein